MTPATCTRLEALLQTAGNKNDESANNKERVGTAPALLLQLRDDPGRPSLASVQDQLARLEIIRQLELAADLFSQALPHELERYLQQLENINRPT